MIALPSPSIPVTVRLTFSPSVSNFTVMLCATGIGLDFDFAVFSFQVPKNGLSAANMEVEIKNSATDRNRIRTLLRAPVVYRKTMVMKMIFQSGRTNADTFS
jgi:hypothetical protein